MANNRMFLMHRPSGKAVFLGERNGWGWEGVPEDIHARIVELFRVVQDGEGEGAQDDFCIALETVRHGATLATADWNRNVNAAEVKGVLTLEVVKSNTDEARKAHQQAAGIISSRKL